VKVLLTGAGGFLGWHTRLRLHALTDHEVIPVTRQDWDRLPELCAGVDAVIHVAGVNRADSEAAVREGNLALARQLADALDGNGTPTRIVYANSIQDGNGSAYGDGKGGARTILSEAETTTHFVDVRLPNIFGEHGRPNYNSFVATFVHAVKNGDTPAITDRPVGLLHVQNAAQALIDGLSTPEDRIDPPFTKVGVQQVFDLLTEFKASYDTGEFPDLSSDFRIDLFNTYRAALFPDHYPIPLVPHSDPRGTFVETVRCRGGEGQTSFSTTVPGITRGEHYHLRKIERFAVISGSATMSLRKMFTDEIIDFHVTSAEPAAVDMPVGWVHNITNTGQDELLTQFWSHELFRPDAPDTFAEPVRSQSKDNSR
jgi:UDP-2-acetamido-2,6-beta-L-arabino-hexul-4-ose reductase